MFGRNVVIKMTGNQNFPTSFPTLVDIIAALDMADAAVTAAMNRGKQEIIDRDAAMAALVELLTQLAPFVQAHCQNDLSILTSSGFDAIKAATPVGPLPRSRPR